MKTDLMIDQVVVLWQTGAIVASIELGGIGPAYEQAIQNFLFKILSYLVEFKISPAGLSDKENYSKTYNEICEKLSSEEDLSGAMFCAAKNLAYQFYVKSYRVVMAECPQDRIIQVMRCRIIK